MEQLRNELAAAIETLPKNEQLILSLYYYEELTMKEIGSIMGYTESRISQLHHRAILRLRTRWPKFEKGRSAGRFYDRIPGKHSHRPLAACDCFGYRMGDQDGSRRQEESYR